MRLRILGLVVCLGLLSGSAFATSVAPDTPTVTAGDTFFLDITISDVTDLIGYQFEVTFDPTIVSANSIEDGDFLSTAGVPFFIPGDIDNVAGTIGLSGAALLGAVSGATGSGVLARISLTALAVGTSSISLSSGMLLDSNFEEIPAAFDAGSVTVLAPTNGPEVPEPATVVLLGTGLAAAAVRRRRANRAA